MTSSDRRASDRRGRARPAPISLGAVLAEERRERGDRRQQPRRRADFTSIAHVARRIAEGGTLLEMLAVADDVRLVANFACGCIASEPVGSGTSVVRGNACAQHAAPTVAVDRRRSG